MEMIKHDTNEDLKLLYGSFEVSLDSIKSLIKIIELGRTNTISEAVNCFNDDKRNKGFIQIDFKQINGR